MLHIVFQRVSCHDLIKRGGGLYVLQRLVYVDFCCIVGQPYCKKECQLLHNALFAFDTVRGCRGPSL